MRSRKVILIAAIAFGAAYYFSATHKPEVKKPQLETGDIIFRKENSFWGDVAASASKRDGRYSHSGVVLVRKDGVHVIHSYANTNTRKSLVSLQTLDEFANNASNIGYYRLNFPKEIRQDFAKKAFEYYSRKTPFDDKFLYTDESAVYCTELVWHAARKASGHDIAPIKSDFMGKKFIANDDLFLGGFMSPVQY